MGWAGAAGTGHERHCPYQDWDPNAKATVLQGDLSHTLVPQSLWQVLMVRGWSLVTKNTCVACLSHPSCPWGAPNPLTVPISSLNKANIRLLSDGGDSMWTAPAAAPGSLHAFR